MSYCTLDQLVTRFGETLLLQLTDRARPPAGEIDESVVAEQIANADATIDGFLAGRYALPLADVPPVLASLAQEIAIYKLHTYEPDPKIKADYEQALRTLKDVASGTFRLPLAGIEPAGNPTSGVVVTDRERPFTEQNLKGFI